MTKAQKPLPCPWCGQPGTIKHGKQYDLLHCDDCMTHWRNEVGLIHPNRLAAEGLVRKSDTVPREVADELFAALKKVVAICEADIPVGTLYARPQWISKALAAYKGAV